MAIVPVAMPVVFAIVAMRVIARAAYRLVTHRRGARHNHPRRAIRPRHIDGGRAVGCRLADDHTRQRWERKTDSDADVDPGLREGQTTHDNRCN